MNKISTISLIGALLLIFLLYLPTTTFDFVNRDDSIHLLENPLVVGDTPSSLLSYLTVPTHGYPIPMAVLTYKIEHFFVGLSPWLYHLSNVLLHVFICLLIYLVGIEMGLAPMAALLAMLFFGLHPGCVEVVAWVSSRKTLLSTLICLWAALYFLRSMKKNGSTKMPQIWLLTFLGSLCKPTVIFLPIVLYIWESILKRTLSFKRALAYIPTIAICLFVVVISYLQADKANALPHDFTFYRWIRDAWFAAGYLLDLMILVKPTSPYHDFRILPAPFEAIVDLMPIFWIVLGGILFKTFRSSQKIMIFSWIWFGLSLLPGLNLVPTNRYIADTYIYYPLIGLAWIFGGVFYEIFQSIQIRLKKMAMIGAALLLFTFLGSQTLIHLSDWKNGISLWASVEERHPDSPDACISLGHAYLKWHLENKALEQYQKCSENFKDGDFRKNIAVAHLFLGHFEEAEKLFKALVEEHLEDEDVLSNLRLIEKLKKN